MLQRIAGFPSAFPWDAQAHREEREIVDSFYPVYLRTRGIVFDSYDSNPAIATYPIEEITVRTLVMHAFDDPLASYEDARTMAERIPNARFITVPRGGHVFMHRDERALAAVWEFLAKDPIGYRRAGIDDGRCPLIAPRRPDVPPRPAGEEESSC